jgi:hypothetical protein
LAGCYVCDGNGWNGQNGITLRLAAKCFDDSDQALFNACTNITIGNGHIGNFWTSRWFDGQAPADMAPSLYKLTRTKKLSVAQALNEDMASSLHKAHQIPLFDRILLPKIHVVLVWLIE